LKAVKPSDLLIECSDFRTWERKYLGHFQYFCLFIPEKQLFIDKDKQHRIIILPISDSFEINADYTILAKDNTHTMMLVHSHDDVLVEYAVEENKKRYVWFGVQSEEDHPIQIVNVEEDIELDIEAMKRIYKGKNKSITFKFLNYFYTSIAESVNLYKSANHKIMVAENAQNVKALDAYTTWKNVLVRGEKRYLEVQMYREYQGKSIVYTYHSDDIQLIPNNDELVKKAIKDDRILYAFSEIPSNVNPNDIEIIIKTWEYDAKSHYADNSFYCEAYQCETSDYTQYSNIKLTKKEKIKLTDLLNLNIK